MIVIAHMEFDFSPMVDNMREDLIPDMEIRRELEDIIRTGEYFPENVIDCEVVFRD